MAAMWALTGNSDLRVEGGAGKTLTKTDVVNDYAKTARVRLEGAANGVPFWVERRVSRASCWVYGTASATRSARSQTPG